MSISDLILGFLIMLVIVLASSLFALVLAIAFRISISRRRTSEKVDIGQVIGNNTAPMAAHRMRSVIKRSRGRFNKS
jgi:hypothetical protein